MILEHAEKLTRNQEKHHEAYEVDGQSGQLDSRYHSLIGVIGDYIVAWYIVNLRVFVHSHLSSETA